MESGCLFSNWRFNQRGREKVHDIFQLISLLRVLGKQDVKLYVDIKFPENYLSKIDSIVGNTDKWIAIFPGASEKVKCWMPERFAAVADSFADLGYSILLLGSIKEKELLLKIKEKNET